MTVSLSDLLSAAKNIVTALNNQTQTTLALAGQQAAASITTPTLVMAGAGRLVRVSTIVAGSTAGVCYDASSLGATSKPLHVLGNTLGVFESGVPFSSGLLVVPGTGQTLTVVYSAPASAIRGA